MDLGNDEKNEKFAENYKEKMRQVNSSLGIVNLGNWEVQR